MLPSSLLEDGQQEFITWRDLADMDGAMEGWEWCWGWW